MYNCKSSKTCIEKDKIIEEEYGIGKIKGKLTKDSIYFNDNANSEILLKNQYFLQALETQKFTNLKADGILGIGNKILKYDND